MKSKFPNTSILNIITQSKSDEEYIVYFHLRNVPDYTADGIFWFEDKGRDGKATFIWEDLLLKQWLAIGKDNDILELLKGILDTSTVSIDSKIVEFNIPNFRLIPNNEKSAKSRNEIKYDSYLLSDFSVIPRQLLNKENLDILSGLKVSDNIKPMFPIGLYEQDFIYNTLNDKIFGLIEHREPYLTFRGVRKNSVKGKGSREIIGFYQFNYSEGQEYFVSVKNEINSKIGEGKINIKDGVFKVDLKELTSKGQIVITDEKTNVKEIDFVFIQDIKFDINIVNKTFKDAYGREFGITSKKSKNTQKLKPIYWEKDLFNNNREAYTKLSDIFRTVFEYLGEKILIADPYFIGLIKLKETTNEYELSKCQLSLVNAITHYSLEFKPNSFIILGCNSRANNLPDGVKDESTTKTDRRFENYNKFLKNYISQNKLKDYFPTITFKNSQNTFHNRYWFSIINENGVEKLDKCVVITNSFGNIEEIDIIPCTDKEQSNLIISRFLSNNNNSTIEAEINER